MTPKQARQHYTERHPLGHLTISQLKAKARKHDIFVHGDFDYISKAEILQCFDQSKQMTKLFRLNKEN